jgi:hypothetical protein
MKYWELFDWVTISFPTEILSHGVSYIFCPSYPSLNILMVLVKDANNSVFCNVILFTVPFRHLQIHEEHNLRSTDIHSCTSLKYDMYDCAV